MASIRPTASSITGKVAGMLDANAYATKKTIAQGMLDVALLTANASQLKYLLQVGTQHEFYHLMLSLISISIILQIAVGVVMFLNASYNITVTREMSKADRLNNLTTVGVFLIVAINVFIAAFGMAQDGDTVINRLQRDCKEVKIGDANATTTEPSTY